MLASLRNVFGFSPQRNPYKTVAGDETGPMKGSRPLGMVNGIQDGWPANFAILPANWVKTLNSGTVTLTDGHPAALTIVTDATADAVTSLQLSKDGGTTVWKPLQLSATDILWVFDEVKLSDATNSALLIGISNNATANIFGTSGSSGNIGTGITDFVGFHKPNGSTTLRAIARKASTSTSQTLTGNAMADDTYVKLAVVARNGTNALEYWVNGVLVYTQTTVTNFPLTTTKLTVTIAVQTPASSAKTLTVRRPFWQQECA